MVLTAKRSELEFHLIFFLKKHKNRFPNSISIMKKKEDKTFVRWPNRNLTLSKMKCQKKFIWTVVIELSLQRKNDEFCRFRNKRTKWCHFCLNEMNQQKMHRNKSISINQNEYSRKTCFPSGQHIFIFSQRPKASCIKDCYGFPKNRDWPFFLCLHKFKLWIATWTFWFVSIFCLRIDIAI